ncbi:hypothetical protein KHQ88_03810 [Mycoplasmatota bacterium]|nr:hypothetical protein KHQ88_03810 [Mycoplasmatota bacterium]
MENQIISLFGTGLSKNIQVIANDKIKYKEIIELTDEYSLVTLSFNKEKEDLKNKEAIVKNILASKGINLYDIKVEEYYQYESLFDHIENKNAFFHCLHEYHRMNCVLDLIKHGQYLKLSRLIQDSYNSYKYYYQNTSQKQDYLVVLAEKHQALAANISSNHLVCLVKNDSKNHFIKKMKKSYSEIYKDVFIQEVYNDKKSEEK